MSLNRAVPEQHFTRLDTVLDNVVLMDINHVNSTDRPALKIDDDYPLNSIWIANDPSKDWELLWKWRPPMGVAQFTFYSRGIGHKAPPEKTMPAGTYPARDPNSGRQLVRMSYVIQESQVTPDEWIHWLERDAKTPQWMDVIRFFGFLGRFELWNPIINALRQGKPCIPLRTAKAAA